ncbi:uncharacterized protein BDZ99DRAFT_210441 [Mytilinidion resinicola]|uniref:Uncharacterized protein n=1 Tax=Mytilinidion resinicola TaxID=574789 RepID=A0A6A6Y0Q5_9PEZI|nr:uncharacterized protein BDZ99DRAFT_210441 [Mytilinidion resinicola]KAF2802138.1 hypothetical protein BDZ99DRAFT_210441 [Mytilinidion resinicola]
MQYSVTSARDIDFLWECLCVGNDNHITMSLYRLSLILLIHGTALVPYGCQGCAPYGAIKHWTGPSLYRSCRVWYFKPLLRSRASIHSPSFEASCRNTSYSFLYPCLRACTRSQGSMQDARLVRKCLAWVLIIKSHHRTAASNAVMNGTYRSDSGECMCVGL